MPLDANTQHFLEYVDTAICALFFTDFLYCLYRAKNRRRYFFTWGWLDLLSSVPAAGFFRFARAARIVRILRILRAARSMRIMGKAILQKRAQNGLLAAILASVLLIASTSVAILGVEKTPEANIRTAEDAIWWALTTITTIGYGDRYPVTSEGRLVAAFLMIGGVGLFGIVSGFVATMFLSPPEQEANPELLAIQRELAELRREIARLGPNAASLKNEQSDTMREEHNDKA